MTDRVRFAAAAEHFVLGGKDFRQGTFHENDFVVAAFGNRQEELRDDFYCFAIGLINEFGLPGEKFGRFPFTIAAGIVDVGFALGVGKDDHATGGEHLHHE